MKNHTTSIATPDRQDDFSAATARFEPVARSRTFNRILSTFGLRTEKVMDLGCGYGEYLACFGAGSLGITSTPHEVEYGTSHGLHIVRGNVEKLGELGIHERFGAIWANNLFEHLLAPHAFLIGLKAFAGPETALILGVPVVPRIASLMRTGPFRGALAVAHVNFFTRETLQLTVERAGWKVEAVRPFIFSWRWLDLMASFFAPHLYVVAHDDADFSYHEKKLKEWKDEPQYAALISQVSKNI